VCAEGGEHIEERGAGGIEAERIEDQGGAGEERGGAEEEGGGGDVAGDCGVDGVERLRASDGDGINGAGEGGAEGTKGEFAVVAGAEGFTHDCGSGGLETGEEDAGFYLGAGDGRGVVDGLELAAMDREGCVAVGEGEARAHGFEGLSDALHGTAGERCVADEGEAALLGREQAGEHTDC